MPQPNHTLVCIDAGAAARLLPQLRDAGYDDAAQKDHVVTFTADPRDALYVAEWSHANGYAHDADAARLIANL